MRAISKSKMIIPYFVTLALARLLALLIGHFLPFSEYDSDIVILNVRLNTTSVSVGTALSSLFGTLAATGGCSSFQGWFALSQATVYFLAIIAIQIYLQAAPSSGIVGLSFIPHVVPRSSFKHLHSERISLVVAPRECTVNLKRCGRDRSTDVSPHCKEHILLVSRFIHRRSHTRIQLIPVHVSQLQPCLDSTVCGKSAGPEGGGKW